MILVSLHHLRFPSCGHLGGFSVFVSENSRIFRGDAEPQLTPVNHVFKMKLLKDYPCRPTHNNVPIKSKLQHPPPPPRASLGHLTALCARGVGNLTVMTSRGGEFDLCQGGVGKIEPEGSKRICFFFVFVFFFWAPKSLTAINTCLDKMEEFKERDIAIS